LLALDLQPFADALVQSAGDRRDDPADRERRMSYDTCCQFARQILLLFDGSFAVVPLHRDPSYMETAGEAAHALIEAALPVRARRRSRRGL
jgi:hypothetical protein